MKTDANQLLREFIKTFNRVAQENDRAVRMQQEDELLDVVRENWLDTFRILLQRMEEWNHE